VGVQINVSMCYTSVGALLASKRADVQILSISFDSEHGR